MTDLYRAKDDYLTLRRSLGFKLRGHDRLLSDYIDFLHQNGADTSSTSAALAWATVPAEHLQPVRCAQRLGAVRGFARYLHALDPAVPVPPADLLSARRDRSEPYLYSHEQIAALIDAADQLTPSFRAQTYRTFFGLLAVTGMRVGEAIRLERDGIDLDTGCS